jgi:hypothetical protein
MNGVGFVGACLKTPIWNEGLSACCCCSIIEALGFWNLKMPADVLGGYFFFSAELTDGLYMPIRAALPKESSIVGRCRWLLVVSILISLTSECIDICERVSLSPMCCL